ncbi:uncharacterized protein LOC123317502 [Coccinella septempunctata]|uniref:uncharacterized protein LOC123317472 n=1 Tax=Coccinella septempunctata TaxID=41139 RepID=UPI001D08F6CD|nr:uncharacterized protein LOC123317472 [Coccinella septempunctata]XP_044760008.1 uncharacterized protein LOC123317502 [Coccinella septempunctata]
METSARDAAQLHRNNVTSSSVNSVKCGKQMGDRPLKIKASSKPSSNDKNSDKSSHCYRCGSPSHFANTCKYISSICSKCKVKGHLAKVCFKGRQSSRKAEHTNQIEEICGTIITWIVLGRCSLG